MSALTADALDPALYYAVRQAEGRTYSDEVVALLPRAGPGVAHRDEWRIRQASALRLEEYFRRQSKPLSILDLGCGNGWMAARMGRLPKCKVWGFDTNRPELTQAGRVFRQRGLGFVEGDIERLPFLDGALDSVVIASSIQYFPDLVGMVRGLLERLSGRGEIHILDSPLYEDLEVAGARERSQEYYARLGFPQMAPHYYHHTWSSLQDFEVTILYDPRTLLSRLRGRFRSVEAPFPWIRIREKP